MEIPTQDQLMQNIRRLLDQIGERSTCKGCGQAIWWVQHRNGKRAPYTPAGLNHFADCKAAAQFRKDKPE